MSEYSLNHGLEDTFINAIYLYDDKVLITFNYKEGTETIAFGEAVKAEKSSDMSARGAPDFERQIVRFDVLSSYRKPQAMLVEEKSRSVETVEKEPPFAIIRSG